MHQEIIATPEDLRRCCERLAAAARFGFDTEFVGEESYHPHLCLIQVATEDALYLIDPLALDNLEPFWNLVVDPANLVVVHAGREEVRLCHLWSGQTPGNLFDLQIAAGLVGFPYPLGHGPLVQLVLGKKITKRETLTEWRTRPLPRAQIEYAFDDVRYLLPVWHELARRLDKMERQSWAQEEFARLREQATPDEDGVSVSADKWRRLRGAGNLDRRRLAILRELFFWREKAAAEANRPARTLVRDDLLVEIARRGPRSVKDLQPVRGLPRRYLDDLFHVVERARALPADEHPEAATREQDPPQVALVVGLLQAQLAYLAAEHKVAPNLIANTQDLKRLVRARLSDDPELRQGPLHRGWRAQHFLPHFEALLAGRVSLRLTDLRRDVPLMFEE